MTATEALRKQVKKYIDTADENSLRRVNAILEIDRQKDFWDELPEHVQKDVLEALLQSEKGAGKPHQEVIKKYDKWRTKTDQSAKKVSFTALSIDTRSFKFSRDEANER